ncbi:hypothetical protein W97_04333 [Coniosporium apollinis CBS 100218]|uniref:Regulatory factor Sgt1 n=1 Tax=Coniosporium apollinis (strain CBS 100218) TaxID=1168221 RepID=R7YTE7_CONA1|nr:uncharacterized protein W97_04333 [Coniosporium apollinis CBS 100218]EON65098.1 hypothetical protein W97_04333 [Coniosporium apollinis CBS 100218]
MDQGHLPRDDLRWFGEGFSGFPKRLPEDCVEYMIFIIDTKSSEAQIRSRLQAVQRASSDLTKKLLKDYIWQRDAFNLDLVRGDGSWLLRGRTDYGDSVADEWLIVYLLRGLSKQFPDAWIRVYDTDGEFILIEAANVLPKWLNPEVAENRVWLHAGQLLVIPLQPTTDAASQKAPSASGPLTLKEALSLVANPSTTLIHSPLIEAEALHRLLNYPTAIVSNLHTSLLTIPRKLAYILHRIPGSISPAVEAFYLRDPISLRPLNTNDASMLCFPPADFVTTSVRFTKVGFAQLQSQEFPPPAAWKDRMPQSASAKEASRVETGMKLTCAFEMLVADPQNQSRKTVREIRVLLEDVESGEEKLPGDEEIKGWGGGEDDEAWLDINFEDFERELAGKAGGRHGSGNATADGQGERKEGFGDKAAQENLRRIVEQFGAFLNDDDAGVEGAEVDEMDYDDDDNEEEAEDSDVSSEGEDKDVSFDEVEFARMMREMMGMPPDDAPVVTHDVRQDVGRVVEVEDSDEEEEKLEDVMQRMEAELKEAGALNLDPTPREAALKGIDKGKGRSLIEERTHNVEESSDEGEVDIDFNLAKNLLESLKGQAGMAGPAGNLMGLMGVKMPRDEGGMRAKKDG